MKFVFFFLQGSGAEETIHMDAKTHQQFQLMPNAERIAFFNKLKYQKQLYQQQLQQQQQQQQSQNHIQQGQIQQVSKKHFHKDAGNL